MKKLILISAILLYVSNEGAARPSNPELGLARPHGPWYGAGHVAGGHEAGQGGAYEAGHGSAHGAGAHGANAHGAGAHGADALGGYFYSLRESDQLNLNKV